MTDPMDRDFKGELVWFDEFNGDSINMTKWSYDILPKGTYNHEMQTYVDSPANSYVKDGVLTLEALQTGPEDYTSARLVTRNKGDWLYGYVEVRARVPIFEGAWSAIWLLSTDSTYGGWPLSGEIDILESVMCDHPETIHSTVHTEAYNHLIDTQIGLTKQPPPGLDSLHNDFHVYKMKWTPETIHVGLDDGWHFEYKKEANGGSDVWPFKHRFHLLLNIAVAGDWGGMCLDHNPVLQNGSKENKMIIDYVRVYDGGFDEEEETLAPGAAPSPIVVPNECTVEHGDPFNDLTGNRPFVPCCEGVEPCLFSWEPERDWFYLCKRTTECLPPAIIGFEAAEQVQRIQQSPDVGSDTDGWKLGLAGGVGAIAGAILVAAMVAVKSRRNRGASSGSVVASPVNKL